MRVKHIAHCQCHACAARPGFIGEALLQIREQAQIQCGQRCVIQRTGAIALVSNGCGRSPVAVQAQAEAVVDHAGVELQFVAGLSGGTDGATIKQIDRWTIGDSSRLFILL